MSWRDWVGGRVLSTRREFTVVKDCPPAGAREIRQLNDVQCSDVEAVRVPASILAACALLIAVSGRYDLCPRPNDSEGEGCSAQSLPVIG
jgi:hypothetical protein